MQLFGIDAGVLGLAFAAAAFVTAVELITTKYPRTPEFVTKSRWRKLSPLI
jgi:hypothetical protein